MSDTFVLSYIFCGLFVGFCKDLRLKLVTFYKLLRFEAYFNYSSKAIQQYSSINHTLLLFLLLSSFLSTAGPSPLS